MELKALATTKNIITKLPLAYNNGPPPGSSSISVTNPERKYESCYYEISNGATESQIALFNKTSENEGSARIYI